MKEYLNFLLRLLLCLTPVSLFSFFLAPLTIYGTFLLLYSYHPTVIDTLFIVRGIKFEFIDACIATYAYYFLWVLCLLTKGITSKVRLKIIVFGFLMIYVMNILRIAFVIFLALNYSFFWFNLVHLLLWKFVSGIYVAFVWIFLVRRYKIKSIPIYDDLKTIYLLAFRKKKH